MTPSVPQTAPISLLHESSQDLARTVVTVSVVAVEVVVVVVVVVIIVVVDVVDATKTSRFVIPLLRFSFNV